MRHIFHIYRTRVSTWQWFANVKWNLQMKEFVSSMKDQDLEFKKSMTVSSGNISRAVTVNKHWGNIMPHCKQLSSPLLPSPPLSAGSVPDSVGRAAVQSESRFFLWTAAFALTKQNATQQLISCSQSRLRSTSCLKEFRFLIPPPFSRCILLSAKVSLPRRVWALCHLGVNSW